MTNSSGSSAAILIFVLPVVYLLPWLVACLRRHHQTAAILILNLFLGWTFLGWVAALVWASSWVRREAR